MQFLPSSYKELRNKAISYLLGILIGVMVFFDLQGMQTPFEASNLVKMIIWLFVVPILMGIFSYLIYCKKNSFLKIRSFTQVLEGKYKAQVKFIGFMMVFLLPAFIGYVLIFNLGALNNHIAIKKFSYFATVETAMCDDTSRHTSALTLSVIDVDHHSHHLDFPYQICVNHPHIQDLINGKVIKLYGRKSNLGVVYDGFYYKPA